MLFVLTTLLHYALWWPTTRRELTALLHYTIDPFDEFNALRKRLCLDSLRRRRKIS